MQILGSSNSHDKAAVGRMLLFDLRVDAWGSDMFELLLAEMGAH